MGCFRDTADEGDEESEGPGADIISLDFSGAGSQRPSAGPVSQSLLGPLTPFIAGDRGCEWHDAREGLVVVRAILAKLKDGAAVTLDPDFPFGPEDAEE